VIVCSYKQLINARLSFEKMLCLPALGMIPGIAPKPKPQTQNKQNPATATQKYSPWVNPNPKTDFSRRIVFGSTIGENQMYHAPSSVLAHYAAAVHQTAIERRKRNSIQGIPCPTLIL